MSGNPYEPSESFTVTTVAGEEVEIVGKISGPEFGERIVLVTAEDQRYVAAEQGGAVEPFDPAKHVGGTAATGEAGAKWTETADATEAAEAREELKNNLPADATEAAEAKAGLETELTQSATDLATEQPEGSGLKEAPPAPDSIPPGEEDIDPNAEEPPPADGAETTPEVDTEKDPI